MKISRLSIFFFLLILISFNQTQAQFFKYLKDKIQQKVEQNIHKKTEKNIDKVFEKKVKSNKKEPVKSKNKPSNRSAIYSFDEGLSISMISGKKGKRVNNAEVYFSSTNSNVVCISLSEEKKENDQKIYSIISPDNTITLMETGGMKLRMDQLQSMIPDVSSFDLSKQKAQITKTGKSEIILGYSCNEYLCKDDKGNTTYIYATNAAIPISAKPFPFLKLQSKGNISGFIMQLKSEQKGKETIIRVHDFLKNVNIILDVNQFKSMF